VAAPVLAPLLTHVVAVAVGASLALVAVALRVSLRRSTPPPPQPRASLPSWTEEAQKIHVCARCGRKIVREREQDRQVVRPTEGGAVEHYHLGCWDDAAGAPRR